MSRHPHRQELIELHPQLCELLPALEEHYSRGATAAFVRFQLAIAARKQETPPVSATRDVLREWCYVTIGLLEEAEQDLIQFFKE